MPRCELSGKKPVVKNLVSHSNIKTKSKAYINIQPKKLFSRALGQMIKFKVAASTIRDMEHSGGFDAYVLRQDDKLLSKRAGAVKKRIKRKLNIKKA